MIDEFLFPRLSDFGQSRLQSSHYKDASNIGTPLYSAPEIFQGKCSAKSDVYSFSIVVYEIISKKMPFQEMNLRNIGRTIDLKSLMISPRFINN